MGTLKTTNIQSISGSGTVTLGTSGETFTVPAGVTVNMSSATQTGVGGANTPAFEAYLASDQGLSDATWAKLTINTEILDTNGTYDHSTNYRWTPAQTGKYIIFAKCKLNAGDAYLRDNQISIYKNGSSYVTSSNYGNNSDEDIWGNHSITFMENVTSTSDYYELWGYMNVVAGSPVASGGSSPYVTYFGAYKLIGV